MKYNKPEIIGKDMNLPAVTMNFSAPAVGINENMEQYKEKISSEIEQMFWTKPDFNDKKISEAAKQI